MICAVYKSRRKTDTYLFIKQKEKFDDVPAELMKVFGHPQLLMLIPLDRRQHLGLADIDKVRTALNDQGYYLQLPPPPENLLEQHLQQVKSEHKAV